MMKYHIDSDQMLKLRRASVWADLYVAGKSFFQIAELYIITVNEVRQTLWEAGFNFDDSFQLKRAIWLSGGPALLKHIQSTH